MRARDLSLNLIKVPGATLCQRIGLTLQQAMLDGRLPAGTALPGTRVLAEQFDVNRRTVMAAVQNLEAQGWLVTQPSCGTFVADELPSGPTLEKDGSFADDALVGFDLPSQLKPISMTVTGALLLDDGAPDPRLAPAEELAKAYQRALRRHGPRLLEDRDALGTPLLREAVAEWISTRHGVRVDPSRILITRGSRGSLGLLACALFKPGALAAVENPGNRGAWEILTRVAKLDLRPVTVDGEGIVPAALEALAKRERIRLVYVTPRRQCPTSAVLSAERKEEILRLASQYRLAVLEDDYDGEIHYEEARSESLISMDRTGQVIHIGSLSRLVAPGLKLGYLVLPAPLVPHMAQARRTLGGQGDPVLEWAVADLIRDGELASHVRRVRKTYATRRDLLADQLQTRLGEDLSFKVPGGGMSLWLKFQRGPRPEDWIAAARSLGLLLNPPSHFFLGEPEPACRMGFAQANELEIIEAVRRLESAREQAARG